MNNINPIFEAAVNKAFEEALMARGLKDLPLVNRVDLLLMFYDGISFGLEKAVTVSKQAFGPKTEENES